MAADRCLSADPIQTDTAASRGGFSESPLRRSASEDLQNLRLKRQKRISTDEASKSQSKSQIFYFVDSNSSSREKRAHVMRHHVQEKRRQQRHSHSRNCSEPGTGETTLSRLKPVASLSPLLPSPTTLLGASRKDPFAVLPITSSDMELADYWTNKLTYWSGQNKYIKDCAFRTAMAHPLSFRAVILSYCARWKAQLYNHSNAREIDYHLTSARKGVEDAINGRVKIDGDSLAMALAGLALQEDRFGSKQKAREYEERAVQILRAGARSSGLAEVFLHYIRYVMIPSFQTLSRSEIGQGWLVTFLRAAEGLMLSHNNDDYLLSCPQRRTAFQMERPLFSLLSSGPRPSRVPHDFRIYVVRNVPTQEITRTAALIYITAALWDFQDSPGKTQRFLIYLNNLVKKHELDRYPACETFIWHLLEENCDIDLKDSERAWSTGELLKIHKRLPPDLQFQYNEILFSFLMLAKPIRGVDAFEKELAAISRAGS
ncbi:hypothetical protein BDW75DRAFT_250705 [Aspergillus navahoensis]